MYIRGILRAVPCVIRPCCRDCLPTQIALPISPAESWDLHHYQDKYDLVTKIFEETADYLVGLFLIRLFLFEVCYRAS